MVNERKSANEVAEAEMKIIEKLEDGKVHGTTKGSTEETTANLNLQAKFSDEDDEPEIGTSPAAIVTPS
ncbi:hypothetical protein [Bacillus sp. JJ1474]|uniref:hypothetical protein n=1 Tax=Bacillus sp. JJ1474 TaxID=3122955 RepID=UPI0030003D20